MFLGDALDREGDLLLVGLEAGGLLAGCVALIGLVSAGVMVRQPHWITVGLAAVHRRLPERTGDAVSGFVVPLYCMTDVREITFKSSILARFAMITSVNPSEKY